MKLKGGFDGNAIVYCDGAFNTPNGKTAHGLVRFTKRYEVLSVIDHRYAGQDTGAVLDGRPNGIPVVANLEEGIRKARSTGQAIKFFVIGLAPDGGRLPQKAHNVIKRAIRAGLHVVSGLHEFITEDLELVELARERRVNLFDIRKPPHRNQLHFFTGEVENVDALTIAVLGTDSAVGKRTTAWLLVQALQDLGIPTAMIGTGQTAWLQGANYSLILDSLVNDFVSGEIEHAVVQADRGGAEVIIVEGQGSLLNPAYPGGFEILAAAKPDLVIMQHAPARRFYDGFPTYPLHPLAKQIQAVELIAEKPVVAITINHEHIQKERIGAVCQQIESQTGLPTFDVLLHGGDRLAQLVQHFLKRKLVPA